MRLSHLIAAAVGTGLALLAAGGAAQAYDHERDRDHWRHEGWRHDHRHEPPYRYEPRYMHERPIVVRERPVYVEQARPVFVPPPPMYAAPMYAAPMQSQAPSGLNLNFNIPLN